MTGGGGSGVFETEVVVPAGRVNVGLGVVVRPAGTVNVALGVVVRPGVVVVLTVPVTRTVAVGEPGTAVRVPTPGVVGLVGAGTGAVGVPTVWPAQKPKLR